ncbi:MAG TPA: hypothetical protein VNW90_17080 [Acetobacteraceae bacterium]|jgi:hypothetical protein|nr:hypothetical protein [Acetobacteraceae bacterium]
MSGNILDAVRGGDVLSSIAHPAQINVLGAYGDAARAAAGIWANRQNQANQLAGQAQLAGIDANGQYQPNVANTALANAGPGAALAAGATLESGQRLGTAGTAQGIAINGLIAKSVAPLIDPSLTPDDQFHAALGDVAQRLISSGVPAAAVTKGLANLSNDPTTARRQLEVMRQGMLPPEMQQPNIYGAKGTQTDPTGATSGTSQSPRTGVVTAVQPPGTGAPLGPSPEFSQTQVTWKDKNGVTQQGTNATYQQELAKGNAVGAATPSGPTPPVPPAPGSPTLPGGYQARPGTAPAAGGGTPAPAAPPASATPAGTGGVPYGPPVNGQPPLPAIRPQATPQGPTATPSPAPPSPQPSTGATSIPGPAPGVVEAQQNDVKAYQEGQAGIQVHQRNVQNLDTAMQALQLTQTGRSTEAVHNFYSFLKAQGITPPFGDANVTEYDVARKAMTAFAAQAAGAGGTDLSRLMSTDANANVHIDQDAAMHVIKQNLGWENQQISMNKEAPAGGKGYHEHVGNFPTSTVPEAFAWNRLSSDERQAVIDRQAKIEGGSEALQKSLEMAYRNNAIPIPKKPAASTPAPSTTPGKQSMAVPPQQNLLAMA